MIIGTLYACDGPRGSKLDKAYLSTASYVLSQRSAYFEGRSVRICVTGRLASVVSQLDSLYPPVEYCDARTGEPDSISSQALTLWTTDTPPRWEYAWDESDRFSVSYEMDNGQIGYRPEPILEYWWRRLTTTPPRTVWADIYYSDAQVAVARFRCLLGDVPGSWASEECQPTEIRWLSGQVESEAPTGCWALEWTAVHETVTGGLPRLVRFTSIRSESRWDDVAYQVLPFDGSNPDWTKWDWGEHWALGAGADWRWSDEGAGVFRLSAGGGYEGINVWFVRDPDGPTLRGAGYHWSDEMYARGVPEPDWHLKGNPTECGR